ncbi:uncharacterized protein LOC125771089 isoform X2 [Anopheles funestus]|uniref:uncharacterized protein LOC128919681 n=1 Tax=Anopheles funestus TaxID=62324 RepID=UPI0020C6142C|nr:uncharacterized protein LOC128919681 [Anopheles funestus]
MTEAPVILLNGRPVKTTYMANCRLCLGTNFGVKSTTIVDERFNFMLAHVFSFPIPNQIGLPMNVCSKCRKGVAIFYRYSNQVQMNQKELEATLLTTEKHLKNSNNVIEIENDDSIIDVDMLCEPVTEDGEYSHDPLLQPSSSDATQTHFVSVSTEDDHFFDIETDALECFNKFDTDRVEEAPLVIETLFTCDEEYLESAEDDDRLSDHNYSQTTSAKRNQYPLRQSQYCEKTTSQADPVAATAKDATNLETPTDNLAESISLSDYASNGNETDSNEDSYNETFASKICEGTRLPRRGVRNTIQQRNATKPADCFSRVQNSSPFQLVPVSSQIELEEFNRKLEDPYYMNQVTEYIMRETGQERSLHLMHSAIDLLFTMEFFATCNWSGVGIPHSKIPFKKHYHILELFSQLGAEDGRKLPAHMISKYFKCKFCHAKGRLRGYKHIRQSAPRRRSNMKILKVKLVSD